MYAYAGNDPINRIDPDGLFSWGALFGGLFRAFFPQKISFSFTYKSLPPISVSFSNNFSNIFVGFAGAEFQVKASNPQKSFADCVNESGLKGEQASTFTQQAADLVNQISSFENTSQALLAFTWYEENRFRMNPNPNDNGKRDNPTKWDVGPFHINVYWTERVAAAGQVNFNGLSKPEVYGARAYPIDPEVDAFAAKLYGKYGPFDGSPLANGRMAARRLNAAGGSDENKAVMYAPGPSRAYRRNAWRQVGGIWNKFFNCWNNR
jgi:hypothetical protein